MTPRLLLVDDHRVTLTLNDNCFTRCGYQTHVAVSAVQAMSLITTYTFDAVVLEWSLRTGGGIGLAAALREAAFPQRLIVIAFSAMDEPDGFRESELLDDYFVKPTLVSEIDRRIRSLLAATQMRAS